MAPPLQIYNRRERLIVGLADVGLSPLSWFRPPARPTVVRRVLLLRLERIGDLLMTLEAIGAARAAWPDAQIDLAVGSWNADLARAVPGIDAVHVADVPWLSRGETHASWPALLRAASGWKSRHYDVVINFEPDIRSNGLAWLTGAPIRAGYSTGGGGALLTTPLTYDPSSHVSDNARRLIAHVATEGGTSMPAAAGRSRLQLPTAAIDAADRLLHGVRRPWIGIHASGGRESKQWHLDRFAAVGRALADATGGTIVLTGSERDRPLVEAVNRDLGDTPVVSAVGNTALLELGGLVASLDVLVTGDTGPMHLAAAVGTPVVALFGPSDPARYGPRASREHVIRVQLPCSPCGQVRLPPERCRGHVPDCMDGITVDAVVQRALDVIGRAPHASAGQAR